MRRADRLFDIIQILRRGTLTRAADLAAALEVSERTIYRDIAALVGSGVPIEGEAGLGYLLRGGFDMPPLMFTAEEAGALALGAEIVRSWTDAGLAVAAARALAKIEAVLPEHLRAHLSALPVEVPANRWVEPIPIDLAEVRAAIRDRRKMRFGYVAKSGEATERTLRPLLLSFYGPLWLLTGWCELRTDFRSFRMDRLREPAILDDFFVPEPGTRLEDLMARPEHLR